MKCVKLLISSVLAGACIAFGGIVCLSAEGRVAGAAFFSVGLFMVCTFKLALFTGRVCYVFDRGGAYAAALPLVWLGNFIGAALVAALARATRLSALSEKAGALCAVKMNDSLVSLFILGVMCGVFIYIAVEGYAAQPHPLGKYLSVFFGVTVFVLSGFEHCVADIFYFSMSGSMGWDALARILIITLGNAVGGVLGPLSRKCLS